jgi:hypothetical protein
MFGAVAAIAENFKILGRVGAAVRSRANVVGVEAENSAAAATAAVPGDDGGSCVPPPTG